MNVEDLNEYDRRVVRRAQRSISTGSIPVDVVEQLIDMVLRIELISRRKADADYFRILELEDMVVRLGGGSSERATPRHERMVPQERRQGGWVDR